MSLLGIDIGSREVKIATVDPSGSVHLKKLSTAGFYKHYCKQQEGIVVDFEALGYTQPRIGISTGYGRNNTSLNGFTAINEIKAHAYGGMYQSQLKDFVLLDIGGQDVKIIKVEKGVVVDLNLNDKCAASCGRYLENMAAVLEMPLDVLSKHYLDPVPLNSTCAVFSESELIGKMAEGYPEEILAASVNHSLYKKLEPMLRPYKKNEILVSGGVAANEAVVYYLRQHFEKVTVLKEPQYNGAIGCCYYAGHILG